MKILAPMLILLAVSPVLGQDFPDDSCGQVPPAEIASLPFVMSGTGGYADDVDFGVDLSTVCAAGDFGTPAGDGGDFLYQITLGEAHDVDCSFSTPDQFNTGEWVLVLSSGCESPLGAGACQWGQVVPPLGSAAFNTADLGIPAGTYYLWIDRVNVGIFWQLSCTGILDGMIFSDDFEDGTLDAWSASQP